MSALIVSQECRDLGLRAHAILLRGLNIRSASRDLRTVIDREARQISDQFDSPAEIRATPELVRVREIIRAVGVKLKTHPPSLQKLLEFAWKRRTLMSVNNLVDTYNLMSVRTRCSLGAHDLDLLELPVELRLFRGTETFRPLGSDTEQCVHPGEFGYVDAKNRVACRLDSLQADFSKITPSTTDALLIIESTTAHSDGQLEQLVAETINVVTRYCPGAAVCGETGW